MINPKHKGLVFSFLISLIMSGVMSLAIRIFTIEIDSHDLTENIILPWIQSWILSFLIALPTILIISPLVHQLATLITQPKKL